MHIVHSCVFMFSYLNEAHNALINKTLQLPDQRIALLCNACEYALFLFAANISLNLSSCSQDRPTADIISHKNNTAFVTINQIL